MNSQKIKIIHLRQSFIKRNPFSQICLEINLKEINCRVGYVLCAGNVRLYKHLIY